jgi:hypothetical protein
MFYDMALAYFVSRLDWIVTPKDIVIVKNLAVPVFIFSFNVIDRSYIQVLTPVSNSQFLLKLTIPDKFRHSIHRQHKETTI